MVLTLTFLYATLIVTASQTKEDTPMPTIQELREQSHMTRKQFCEYFSIPYRTLQDWELENRSCPSYVVDLIEYKLKKEGYLEKGEA
jgi:DNA-binding transcriptional regulator YiaG